MVATRAWNMSCGSIESMSVVMQKTPNMCVMQAWRFGLEVCASNKAGCKYGYVMFLDIQLLEFFVMSVLP